MGYAGDKMRIGMFVHLGQEMVVDARQVVAILDARRLQRSPSTRALVERAAEEGFLVAEAPLGVARSIVVTETRLYAVGASVQTVARRIEGRANSRRGESAKI